MVETFVDWVYDSLIGIARDDYRLPEVEDAFVPGKPCNQLYWEAQDAYNRICEKYDVLYDADVEHIMDSMTMIAKILAYTMYEYGAKYGRQEKHPAD